MDGIWFDAAEVQMAEAFMGSLTLTKSTKSGGPEPLELLPHGRKLIANLLGWKRPDGTRLYRKSYFSVARKNAKTQYLAALGLYLLVCDDEMQPEIYVAAKDRDQASLCFQAAADMIYAHDELRDMLSITPSHKLIQNPANGGKMKALSSEGKSKHGSNPSAVIIDELHAWGPAEEELYAALTTGSAARRQPLHLIITTAGVDEQTLCYRQYEYAKRVLQADVEDPTFFPLIYEVPKEADWTDETLWTLANPSLGSIVKLDSLREECATALAVPSEQSKFRRLHLNQWVNSESAWIPLHKWDACEAELDLEWLKQFPCYGGLDLAAVSDLTALVLAWPIDGKVYVHPWFWVPSDELHVRSKRDNVRYDQWAQNGFIELTPGAVTDWRFVTDRILQLKQVFDIREIAFDRYGARDTIATLMDSGVQVAEHGQGYLDMNAPCKRVEELVLSQSLVHDGNPVLRWNFDCARIKPDAAGNIKIVKPERQRSSKRVDGAVAAAMAVGRAMDAHSNMPSVWSLG